MTPRELVAAFEVVAEAPGGVERLRELVLQLAVRGKLVPQDPEDEPASVLLERIAAVRKPKALPPVAVDEVPFEVPAGWAWASLDALGANEVAAISDGPFGSKLKKTHYVDSSGFRVVRLGNIGVGVFKDEDRCYIAGSYYDSLSQYHLRADDLLVASLGSPVGRACLVPATCLPALNKADCFRVRLHPLVLPHYVRLVMNSPSGAQRAGNLKRGDTRGRINLTHLRSTPVPIPPISEQHRIVAKVDELMALIDRLEATRTTRESSRAALRDAVLAALRDAETPAEVEVAWARIAEQMDALFTEPADLEPLRQAVLQLAVRGRLVPQDPDDEPASVLLSRIVAEKARLVEAGDVRKPKVLPPVSESERPFDVPRGWAWIEVETVTSLVTSGSRGWNQYYAETGATFIRSQDIKGDRLEYDQQVFVNLPERAEGLRTRVMRGDWLVTITGANVGKCALVTEPIDEGYVSQHVALLRPVETGIGPFGHLWLTSAHGGRGLLLNYSYGAKPGLNLSQLRELPMPLPPLAEQHRIVAKVDELMSLIDRLEEHLTAQATAHEAFAAAAVHHLDA